MLSLVKSQEADTRRCFLSNAVVRDLTANNGRRQATKGAKEQIKWLIDHFRTMPEKEYIFNHGAWTDEKLFIGKLTLKNMYFDIL